MRLTLSYVQRHMHHRLGSVRALLVLLLAATPLTTRGDAGTAVDTRDHYRVYRPSGEVRGALVLLPGYGDDSDAFEPSSPTTPSTLPARLAEHGILTLVAVPVRETLYESPAALRALDSLLAQVVQQYRIPRERVAIGGFSSGGTGAVRYAQTCAQQNCRAVPRLAAVFAVDAPLDFERLFRNSAVIVQRKAPRSNIAEASTIVRTLQQTLGGTPDEVPDAYRLHSPVLASELAGGNARLLQQTPLRLYTEPDVKWWLEERNLDYQGMNAVDHAALINLLRVAGNARAELITTTGQGYRPDGRRHPHSWSIVDETDLVRWLLVCLAPVG